MAAPRRPRGPCSIPAPSANCCSQRQRCWGLWGRPGWRRNLLCRGIALPQERPQPIPNGRWMPIRSKGNRQHCRASPSPGRSAGPAGPAQPSERIQSLPGDPGGKFLAGRRRRPVLTPIGGCHLGGEQRLPDPADSGGAIASTEVLAGDAARDSG